LETRDVQKKGFHERFHIDSRKRKWLFLQRGKLTDEAGPNSAGRAWNEGKLVWICTSCGGVEPVRYDYLVHDEATVPDPTEQLDAHDCDLERIRQVMDA